MARNNATIRHAYENTLTACARLAAFATCKPTTSDRRLISDRQKVLAIDDLVTFAINARRLMDTTEMKDQFKYLSIQVSEGQAGSLNPTRTGLSITRIIDILVHHKELGFARFKSDLISGADMDVVEIYHLRASAGNKTVPTMISVQSDKGGLVVFRVSDLIDAFEGRVLIPIIDKCSDEGLDLEEEQD